jgi:biopolymer transport protein ExbD
MTTSLPPWRPKPRPRSALIARIDATPLVAAFLAILWIVLSPGAVVTHGKGKQVDLPYATSGVPQPGAVREGALLLTVTRDGQLFFDTTRTSREDLPGQLHARIIADVERRVYVMADARAKYSDVKLALNSIRDAGISDVTFLAESYRPSSF